MSNQPPYGPPYQGPPQYQGAPQPQDQGPPPQYGPQGYGPQYGAPPPQYGQPQFGWGSGGYPPPPRKKSKAPWIVAGVIVVLAGVVSLWIVGVVLKHNRQDNNVTQPRYTPTYEPTYFPTTEPTSAPVTTAPRPTATRTTKTTPPPPPRPSDTDVVTKNAFYGSGVQRTVNCRESSARATSAANARAYYTNVLGCLNRAWPAQVTVSKYRFRQPKLVSFTGPVQTPCNGGAPSSFYCSANETIYMDAKTDLQLYKRYSTYNNRTEVLAYLRADMTDTEAHDYGHHLQNMTGILRASSNLEYEKSGDAALQMSRRLEIQATCLGNVFMGSNKGSYKFTGLLKSQLDYLHAHQGDEYGDRRDHGSREINPHWSNLGFNNRTPRVCNTYTASATLVR